MKISKIFLGKEKLNKGLYINSLSLKTKANYYKKIANPNRVYAYRRYDDIDVAMKEREKFVKEIKENRKEITKKYWEDQSEIERIYLSKFEHMKEEKRKSDLAKNAKFAINQAFLCADLIREREETHGRFYAQQKVWQLEEKNRKDDVQSMMYLLDLQTSEWLIPKEGKSNDVMGIAEELAPQSIISHKDFYNKVNKYAILLSQGRIEEANRLKLNDANYKLKNKLLIPVFNNLRKMIRHMSLRPEDAYLQKYKEIRLRLEKMEDKAEKNRLLRELNQKYHSLVVLVKKYMELPQEKFKFIERTLISITNLIVTWNHYIEILYLTDEEIHLNSTNNLIDARELEKFEGREYFQNEGELTTLNLRSFYKNEIDVLEKVDIDKHNEEISNLNSKNRKISKAFLNKVPELNSKFY